MNHIKDFFTGINKVLLIKKVEKDAFIDLTQKITNIKLSQKDIVFKDYKVKLKIFGAKRQKILENKNAIILKLKENGIIINSID